MDLLETNFVQQTLRKVAIAAILILLGIIGLIIFLVRRSKKKKEERKRQMAEEAIRSGVEAKQMEQLDRMKGRYSRHKDEEAEVPVPEEQKENNDQ